MCPALPGESLLAVPRLSADRGRTRARAHSLRSSRVRNHGLRAPTALPALCLRCQHRYFQETQGAPCSAALPPEPTPRPATVTPQRPGTEHRAGKHAFCASGLPERAASPPGTGSERSGAGAEGASAPRHRRVRPLGPRAGGAGRSSGPGGPRLPRARHGRPPAPAGGGARSPPLSLSLLAPPPPSGSAAPGIPRGAPRGCRRRQGQPRPGLRRSPPHRPGEAGHPH